MTATLTTKLPADLQLEWSEKHIGIRNALSLEFFDILEESEKAIKVHCKTISKFPVWIPLAALDVIPVGTMHVFGLKKWFISKLWKDGKPWQRVALGLSVY